MRKMLSIFLILCLLLSVANPVLGLAAENEALVGNSELLETDLVEAPELLEEEIALNNKTEKDLGQTKEIEEILEDGFTASDVLAIYNENSEIVEQEKVLANDSQVPSFCNGSTFFDNGRVEFYINSEDEDKLYVHDQNSEQESKILDEHIINLVGSEDCLYLLAYDEGRSNLLRFNTTDYSYSVEYEFVDLVTNICLRGQDLFYIQDGKVYQYQLEEKQSIELLSDSKIDLIYFTEYDSLKYYLAQESGDYLVKVYNFATQAEEHLSIPFDSYTATDVDNAVEPMAVYTPRLTAPSKTDPYYTTLNVFHTSGYGMVPNGGNCTCYAYGRSYENLESKPNLCTGNAGTWYNYNKSKGYYSYGSTPALGAVAVWSKSGAAGHVAVVEVIDGNTVTTSESGWKSFYFKTVTRNASNSNFSGSSAYNFLGFINVLSNTTSSNKLSMPTINLNGVNVGSACMYAENQVSCKAGDTVTFGWSGVSGATNYNYGIAKLTSTIRNPNSDNEGNSIKKGQSTSSLSIKVEEGIYKFAVNAVSSNNQSSWAYAYLKVEPVAVKLTTPTINLNGINVGSACMYAENQVSCKAGDTVTFGWSGVSGATNYNYGISKLTNTIRNPNNDNEGTSIKKGQSTSSLSIKVEEGIYKFAVNAFSSNNQSSWAYAYLKVEPVAVKLTTPTINLNGINVGSACMYAENQISCKAGDTVTFGWLGVSGATNYNYGISKLTNTIRNPNNDNEGTSIKKGQSTSSLSIKVEEGIYKFAVNAFSSNNQSSWAYAYLKVDAANGNKCGDNLNWSFDNTTAILTINGDGAMDNYDSSEHVPWKKYRSDIREISLPQGITSIGNIAFWNCSSLSNINFPQNLTSIGNYAFRDCKSLEYINIPSNVTSIGESAFGSCINLENIVVAEDNPNYSSLNGNLFNKNQTTFIQYPAGSSNNTYTMPSTVTSIEDGAFYNCSFLSSISLSQGITSLGDETFKNCNSLNSINLPQGIASIGEDTFENCSSLNNISLPDSLTSIGNYAFLGCSSLRSINFLQNLTTIGSYAFYNCTSLSSAYFLGDAPTSFGNDVFDNTANDFIIYYQEGKADWTTPTWDGYKTAIYENLISVIGVSLNKTSLTLESGKQETLIATITPANATNKAVTWTSNNPNVATVNTNGTVTAVETGEAVITVTTADNDFTVTCKVTVTNNNINKCGDNLTWNFDKFTGTLIISGSGVMYDFEHEQFPWYSYKDDIKEINFPDGLTNIEDSAFYYCTALTTITLPNSLTSIGNQAFRNCTSLESIILPNNLTNLGEFVFYGCRSLNNVNLPDGLINIRKATFMDCNSLTNITLPSNLESIENHAFSTCIALTSITLPDSLISLGEYAFVSCASLNNVNLPDGLINIEKSTFMDCNSLTNITLPSNLESIESHAFSSCIALTSITLPSNLITLGEYAFANCTSLEEVYFNGNVPSSLGTDVFNSTASNFTIYYLEGKTGWTSPTWNGYNTAIYGSTTIPVNGISLNKNVLTITKGSQEILKADLSPANATNKTVDWSSSDPKVATVDSNGNITAVTHGEAIITAIANDGGLEATCKVIVTPVLPISDSKIVVSSVSVAPGKQAIVTVALEKNPGIAGMRLNVSYDTDNLKLVSAEYSTIGNGGASDVNISINPFILLWNMGTTDFTDNGVLATLIFEAKENATKGNYPITVSYDPDDIYNVADNNIVFAVTNGNITITDKMAGDINGDGKVNNRDATRILQHLAGWQVEVVEECLDVNGDGKVNNRDATRLLQYLAGWPVEVF